VGPQPSQTPLSTVLSVRGIAKRYGELEALRGISFDADRGEVVALVGPNGAGKTTLLSIIAGIQSPSAGTVSTPLGAADGGPKVGWAPQQPALYAKLSVAENLFLFAHLEGVGDPNAAVRSMLEQTGLGDRAGERADRLSGGNRQRVNVALGLLADPPVLALDEPSASLDPSQRERLWRFIGRLAGGGTTVVFSTHNAIEAQRYADRVIVLDDGEMLFDDSPRELMQRAGCDEDGDFEAALVAFLEHRSGR
jgi:ABC-2 type transport system ATP-binding protein